MNKPGSRSISFCGQNVTINYNSPEAESLVDFLCSDLPIGKDAPAQAVYDVIIVGKKPMMSLWKGEKKLYFGTCRFSLAYLLINEIIYQCIVKNDVGHAIHAAAICCGNNGIILPGKSGSGKSTLTAWLTANGCNFLTDELVVLSGNNRQVHPFTRPFSIKSGSVAILSSFLNFNKNEVLVGEKGLMLPHRLVNSNFSASVPPLSLILFPEYKAHSATELTELTSAMGCLKLIECYVNARNIQDHGIGKLAALTRGIPAYRLTYGSFDGLREFLSEHFPQIFK